MQVHPSTARMFGCDMTTFDGRIDCGCEVLRHNADKCGSIRGGVTRYASKHQQCSAKPGSRLHYAVQHKMKLAARFEELSR